MNGLEATAYWRIHRRGRADALLISSAPANIARQVRRRQLRLTALASLCTVAIGIGLFVGFRAFTPSDGEVPGETSETALPDEIVSGSEPGLGSWWLTARRVNETPRLAFHRPDTSISANIEPVVEGQTLGTDGSGAVLASTDADPGWWMVMGVVASDVARIEIQLDDGRSIVADLVPMPIEIIGPSKAYVALYQGPVASVGASSPRGQVVAFDAAGVEMVRRDRRTRRRLPPCLRRGCMLRNAFVAALTFYTDGATFVGFTPAVASTIEPSLTYNAAMETAAGEISIRDVRKDSLVLVTRAKDGSVWCIAEQDALSGLTTYGVVDAQTAAECIGGDAAWAISPSTATPSPSNSPSSTPSSLHGIASGTDLGETWTLSGSSTASSTASSWKPTARDRGRAARPHKVVRPPVRLKTAQPWRPRFP